MEVSATGPELHLDVSALQRNVLLLEVSTLQGPKLHLDVSALQLLKVRKIDAKLIFFK